MKRQTTNGGNSHTSSPYKRPRRTPEVLDKGDWNLKNPADEKPVSMETNENHEDQGSHKGPKDTKTKSTSKSPVKRSGPAPAWERETATFNPKCKHCNRRWLIETQELECSEDSLSETESF